MTMASINVVRSCWACNSSKGTKRLRAWFESAYCKVRGINEQAVADAVKELATQYSDLV